MDINIISMENNHITSFEIIKNKNYNICLVEECCCDNKEQLNKIERKSIEENKCVNKNIPARTQEEYKDSLNYQYELRCKAYYRAVEEMEKLKEEKRIFYETYKKRMNED